MYYRISELAITVTKLYTKIIKFTTCKNINYVLKLISKTWFWVGINTQVSEGKC